MAMLLGYLGRGGLVIPMTATDEGR